MNSKTSSRWPQIKYQWELWNHARLWARLGLGRAKLHSMGPDTVKYLCRDPHSLTRLLASRVPPNKLAELNQSIPLHYHAEVAERGLDPVDAFDGSGDWPLAENRLSYIEPHPGMKFYREDARHLEPAQTKSFFGDKPIHEGFWVEGGLPSYVRCLKLGATPDQLEEIRQVRPRDSSGQHDPYWSTNALDLHFFRARHVLSMFADVLHGGGDFDEFKPRLEQFAKSKQDSGILSGYCSLRASGASPQESNDTLKLVVNKPELWIPLFTGVKHNLTFHELSPALQQGPEILKQYVTHRLGNDYDDSQAWQAIRGQTPEPSSRRNMMSIEDLGNLESEL